MPATLFTLSRGLKHVLDGKSEVSVIPPEKELPQPADGGIIYWGMLEYPPTRPWIRAYHW